MDALDIRIKIIEMLYRFLLGRGADQAGLDGYVNGGLSYDEIYLDIYNSGEAIAFRDKMKSNVKTNEAKLPISLAMFVKNNEDSVGMTIASVASIVSEIVVLDTGSTDRTIEICEAAGARVYKVGFSDFGNIRTVAAHLATLPYVLGLDSDETILEEELPKFREVIEYMILNNIDAVGFPRKRWADLAMTQQEEEWAYPDFQYRFFRNKPEIKYIRRIHEKLAPGITTYASTSFPCIQHFQSVFKNGERLAARNALYKTLQEQDIRDGVKHTELAVEAIDEVK